jgi:hypothetical protein
MAASTRNTTRVRGCAARNTAGADPLERGDSVEAIVCAGDETVACLGVLAGSGSTMGQTRVASTMAQSGGSAVRRRYETTSGVDRAPRVARASRKIPYPRTAHGGDSAVGSYQGTRLGREDRQGWMFEGRGETRGPFPHGRLLMQDNLLYSGGITCLAGGVAEEKQRSRIIAGQFGKVKTEKCTRVSHTFARSCWGAATHTCIAPRR